MSDAPGPPPETLTIAFGRTITTPSGGEYADMTLCEPTVDQMLKISALRGMNATISLVSLISGVPVEVIKQLGVSKLRAATDYIELWTNPPAQVASDDPNDSGL